MGEARVKNASAGLDVSFGSAAAFEDDIALIGGEDALALNENTTKQVQGYDISANNYRMQGQAAAMRGKAAKTAGYISAAGTLLSSASQIGGDYAKMTPKKPTAPAPKPFIGPRN